MNFRNKVSGITPQGRYARQRWLGVGYLTVASAVGIPANQISIEVQHSSGIGVFRKLHERERALINITFDNGSVWSGTFEDLKLKLL